jgi:pyruvate dehydrogenase E2 component (dihydrolipoamide acetyltransferase)
VSTGTQVEVVMPQMGVSVSEGTVTRWLKQPGEAVARDEPLLEISTDKVDTEVPSPGEGVVAEIRVHEGETVEVGTVLAVISPDGSAVAVPADAETASQPAPDDVAPEPAAPVAEPTQAATESGSEALAQQVPEQPEPAGPGNGRTFVSPVVARIAAEHGVDPSSVPGTGQAGRVTKKDILQFIDSGQAAAAQAPAPQVPSPAPEPVAQAPAPPAEAPPEPSAPTATPQPPAPPHPRHVSGHGLCWPPTSLASGSKP